MARLDCGVLPAIYRRRQYCSLSLEKGDRLDICVAFSAGERPGGARAKIETHDHSLRVGQVADHLADGHGQVSDECRQSEYLVSLGELWCLHQVDDVDVITPREVLLAELLEIVKGGNRFRAGTGYVKSQIPLRRN
jgi:hypothetical protein